MSSSSYSSRLSKSRFTAGCECHKLLWWKVHEPDASELQPDRVLQDRFDQGTQVGELARTRFPNGVLIDAPYYEVDERVAATEAALEAGAPAIFEATFVADEVYVAVDVLERANGGFNLIEVKGSNEQKKEHLPDAAIQTHVLRRCGIDVRRAEIMHLNREYRHPDVGDLFMRTDVTGHVEALLPIVPEQIQQYLEVIEGEAPEPCIEPQCFEGGRKCPFRERCWPDVPDHITTLYKVGKKAWTFMQAGVHAIPDLPADTRLSATAGRQARSVKSGELIVEPGLAEALEPISGRVGFLDFETVQRAIPVWPGKRPWCQVAAQFSYHEEQPDGTVTHRDWLAEGPEDPSPALARELIDACAGADRILMYHHFERDRIRELQEFVPELAEPLAEIEAKLVDLLLVVRNNVYHPAFQGSFSIKDVLNPLVPNLSYDDLEIKDGQVAGLDIFELLLTDNYSSPEKREKKRQELLKYCERDTEAMVELLRRLRELAGS